MGDVTVRRLEMEEALGLADVLSLHVPLSADTRHLINTTTLSKMRSTSILVNTARGGLVDTVALAAALENGQIAGAGIDVFEHEPLGEDHPLKKCANGISPLLLNLNPKRALKPGLMLGTRGKYFCIFGK